MALRPCLVSHQCRCVLQRLSVADFKHPCLKPLGTHAKASLPCLPLPLYRPSPFLQPLQKNTYHLPFLLLPLHLILSPSHPLQKDNNPSPRTITLASLVKGEVLSPEKIRATTRGIAHHYPSLAPTLPKPHRPSLSTTCLAPLPKGAGLRQGYFLL